MMEQDYPELRACKACPRNCNVDRYQHVGFCNADNRIKVNLHQLHYGEEPVLSGSRGSGTIFFSHCNLRCAFCQNYRISSEGWGDYVSEDELIHIMNDLVEQGAHNINLVTPSHYSVQLIRALNKAKANSLGVPVVWNSNGYEHVEMLQKLDGLVDVYLPDLKYAHRIYSKKYSLVEDYPPVARNAIKEMYKQVGNLHTDSEGIATRGLIIRLLVLPNGLGGINESLRWICDELGTGVSLSIMAQYYPAHKAHKYTELSRGISESEYESVVRCVEQLGFENVFVQELSSNADWTPDFKKLCEERYAR